LLEVLAGQAAVALENARLYEAQRREAEHLKELLEFSRELATAEGLPEVLERVVELTGKILGSERNSVWLQDLDSGDLVPGALAGYSELDRDRVGRLRVSCARAEALIESQEPFLIEPEQLYTVVDASQVDHSVRYAVAPIQLDGGRLCCILAAVSADEIDEFRQAKMTLLAGLAHQAKLAITNAGSFESLETTFVSTVEALANALEANDEYTSSHARWITDMALEVGKELGLDAKTLKLLELGALFHDIGKIGVPASILAKPGPLTPEERAVIETHPELGERILAPIERLAEVRAIVRACHEHFDGSGYPDRKLGETIPLEARIILVCDAFHAVRSERRLGVSATRAGPLARGRAGRVKFTLSAQSVTVTSRRSR
jgi:HD-GYP domain-containing protein (c-di-GMP phosphodiesterase class II)